MGDILTIYALLSMIIGVIMLMINVCKNANATKVNTNSKKKVNLVYILFPISALVIFMDKVFGNMLDQMY